MNIAIRVDSSVQMGSGHLMRCLTLAEGLSKKGAAITFICRDLPGNLCDFIEKKNFNYGVCHIKGWNQKH
jgi:UDP-2,4-diacetamido-2,4,6-trideoxy-beta-L-altropyranose hydrolase